MKFLIVEDELNAARKLRQMLEEAEPGAEVVGITDSVRSTLQWLQANPAPDAAFVDIQLADDTSFEIFKQFKVQFPVIFVTAYDEYLMQSFEYNSVDYLLKPYSPERLKKAVDKLKQLEAHFITRHIYTMLGSQQAKPTRYIARKGMVNIPLETSRIAYFFSEHKITFIKDKDGMLYMLDKTLSELEAELDTTQFFRLNRKYIACIEAIEGFKSNETGRILVQLAPPVEEEVVVSRETAPAFRKWAGGN